MAKANDLELFALVEFNPPDSGNKNWTVNDSSVVAKSHLKSEERAFGGVAPEYTVYKLVPVYKIEQVVTKTVTLLDKG
jgi:hypothetical protein